MLPAQIAGIKAEIFAKKLLQDFDIFNKKDKLPGQVSGGEQQRAAIIRAMINKPALILADEPTGNLDLKNANKIMTQMLEYFKLHKQSAIIVTHNHNYQTMFDRTLTIVDKKIEEIKANTKS
jgi:ABC-type lipoprotein export system ATPase subunit